MDSFQLSFSSRGLKPHWACLRFPDRFFLNTSQLFAFFTSLAGWKPQSASGFIFLFWKNSPLGKTYIFSYSLTFIHHVFRVPTTWLSESLKSGSMPCTDSTCYPLSTLYPVEKQLPTTRQRKHLPPPCSCGLWIRHPCASLATTSPCPQGKAGRKLPSPFPASELPPVPPLGRC